MFIFSYYSILPLTLAQLEWSTIPQLEMLSHNALARELQNEEMVLSQAKTFSTDTASLTLDSLQNSVTFENSTIDPTPIKIDEVYVLGSGDTIAVNFFNVPEYNSQHQIMVDGTINLPLVGNIAIAGMTLDQASEVISNRYATELEYPLATVNLIQPRSFQIAVAGEIAQPGLYSLPAAQGGQFLTVAEAIQAAGGVTQIADLKYVKVSRRDRHGVKQNFTVNLLKLLRYGDLSPNATLRDGDTIFIPAATEIDLAEANQLAISNLRASTDRPTNVAIVGEVARPGPYRLDNSNSQPTLIQAIQIAGGIEPSANLRQIQVRRQTRQGEVKKIDVNLWQILQTGDLAQDVVLQSGDTITIPKADDLSQEAMTSLTSSSLAMKAIQVNIVGEVKSPGQVSLEPNTTLNQAILAAGGIARSRGNKKVKLIRFNPNGSVTEREIKIDLTQKMNPQNNPILQNNDAILIGRSTRAKVTDNVSDAVGIFRWLWPLPFLF